MNYAVNGDFGEVRKLRLPLGSCDVSIPFLATGAGWHRCNDKYHIYRENGFENGHMLLFSVNDGGCLQLDNQDVLSLPPSSVVWIPAQKQHAYYTAPGKIWELYWLDLADAPWLQLNNIFHGKPYLTISHKDNFCREFELILSERNKFSQEFYIHISQRVSALYHLLLQESILGNTGKYKCDELIQNIIRHMEANCQKDWNLAQLSKEYFLSVPQLIRRFKAETGLTPYTYLMNIRLQTAETYLKYSNMSIHEISQKTGFSSVSNFIMQFRSYYGTTPQKYRGNV